jgi:hypothetical protein
MRVAIIALLVATIAVGAWGVGELHYRNCVNAAKAEGTSDNPLDRALDGNVYDRLERLRGEHQATVSQRTAGCSRIP